MHLQQLTIQKLLKAGYFPSLYAVIWLQVEGVEALDDSGRTSEWREQHSGSEARARLDYSGGVHAGLLGGSPLTLLQGIIPGMAYLFLFPSVNNFYTTLRE